MHSTWLIFKGLNLPAKMPIAKTVPKDGHTMKVDDRERDLIERFRADNVSFRVERLPLGDIVIEHGGTTAIVERKRTDDLAASITDGRWREQKARLKASGAIVIYLIEGSLYGQSKPAATLSSAIWNTMLRDNMWVIQTRGLEDTSLHLQQLQKKIGREIKSNTGMASLLSKRKRKCHNRYQLMLMSLVSENIAAALVASFQTLPLLQEQLRTDATRLKDIQVSAKRNVGKKTIALLQQYLT